MNLHIDGPIWCPDFNRQAVLSIQDWAEKVRSVEVELNIVQTIIIIIQKPINFSYGANSKILKKIIYCAQLVTF